MARRIALRLKVHKASGCLYRTIGMAKGRDGKPKKKVWYFSATDETAALQKVLELTARWKALRAAGKSVWDDESDGDAPEERLPTFAPQPPKSHPVAGPQEVQQVTPMLVDDAAKLYLAQLKQRLDAGQILQSHYDSQKARLYKGIDPMLKLAVSAVGEKELQEAALRLAKRPMMQLRQPTSRKPNAKPKPKKTRRMSASYARDSINTLKWFWTWCDESAQVQWHKPSLFRSIFKARPVLSVDERERELVGGEVRYFTVEELRSLWHAASGLQRTLILLGLNCAFANAECATLRVSEIKGLDSEQPYIERFRQKTMKTAGKGSYGKWYLWDETVSYLRQYRAPDNAAGLWLLTLEGLPLSAHNAIGQGWRRLVRRAEIRWMGFKFLRKTAAHLIRNTLGYGREIADMMLAHVDGGMVQHYAGRDWDGRLRQATMELRQHLANMFTVEQPVLPFAQDTRHLCRRFNE
ncbi:MAG: hypothetical protein K8U57_27895 [Planctomycetes bacterium]|nr:hypothetical protein [Planctomycetota bacterium]